MRHWRRFIVFSKAPFGAVGIGTGIWAVLSSIPEGPHALTGVRVEPAAGPFGPGLPGFCL